ncbi:MAG: hypothetical protein A2W36_06905 [Chloroflexi bacterium RBG_16_58_14]|nr:MAG: hypothetical protein A2W36_06905 [Chloroflexi bacterium RBG_16_58_14]
MTTRFIAVLYLLLAGFVAFGLSACGAQPSPPSELVASQPPAVTLPPADSPTALPSATPTDLPTETPAPPPTATPFPSVPPTPTPTPNPLALVSAETALVFSGPGPAYLLLASYSQGIALEAIGRSADGAWLVIEIPPDQPGWVASAEVKTDLEVLALEQMEIPATPLPTPTRIPVPSVTYTVKMYSPLPSMPAKEVIAMRIGGLLPFEEVTFQLLLDGQGKKVQKTANQFGEVEAHYVKEYFPPGSYRIYLYRANGNMVELKLVVK